MFRQSSTKDNAVEAVQFCPLELHHFAEKKIILKTITPHYCTLYKKALCNVKVVATNLK